MCFFFAIVFTLCVPFAMALDWLRSLSDARWRRRAVEALNAAGIGLGNIEMEQRAALGFNWNHHKFRLFKEIRWQAYPLIHLEVAGNLDGSFCVLPADVRAQSVMNTPIWAKNILTGDEKFDADFTICSGNVDFVSAYFADADNRRNVRAFFELGFHALELKNGKLDVAWIANSSTWSSDVGDIDMIAVIANLSSLVAKLRS